MNYGNHMHHMGDPTGMLHYGMYEKPKPKFLFKVPRVVPDQKAKFESDETFRRLSRESEVRYTGSRERGKEERQSRFQRELYEGHTEISFITNGMNMQLVFTPPTQEFNKQDKQCDFDKEPGKVHIKSSFIMNGVCVRWRGWIDLDRLEGVGCLEYDEELGAKEDARRDNYIKMR
ncbi:protein big brother-like [Coccinella septempunctata]|uniref:protein big brother-like n=1 Tax=Coccinella septempunctata TaxID=41139 RepID=UPI001D07EA48|nr:protein big brother-like [Coccinella septempunctata]